ncbi:MAG: sulfur carrier protein ThiS [Bacteroidia bacterium]|nr:sulfur carrier protein ThiS [Bacteroidia bacterium]
MQITLNGEPAPLTEGQVLTDFLRAQGLDPEQRGFAVAVNRQLIRRADWPTHALADGDSVEIVNARQGG